MARRKTKSTAPPAANRSSAAQAIFDPDGDILVRAVAPSGNVYEIKPRVAFSITSEDVDWFFHEWDWQWRQRLCLAEDYQPRWPQFDNGGVQPSYQEPEAAPPEESVTAPLEEPVTEPEESAPDPVETWGDGDNGDKE